MKKLISIRQFIPRGLHKAMIGALLAVLIALGVSSCGPTRSYWGVDQAYPVGNGHVYYGAHGGDGYHHHKQNKKYRKKMRKQREKYLKKQRKKYNRRHKHHDD